MSFKRAFERISAPGYETDQVAGVTQGGMMWPHRFITKCNQLIEDSFNDEWEIYKYIRNNPSGLVYKMCHQGEKSDCVRFPVSSVAKFKDEL